MPEFVSPMKVNRGFTLIEFSVVLTALGILLAIAVSKLIDLQDNAVSVAQKGVSAEVRTALLQYYADNSGFPTVLGLADRMLPIGSSKVAAVATGVQIAINGSNYIVRTFSDEACNNPTTSVEDVVKCATDIKQ